MGRTAKNRLASPPQTPPARTHPSSNTMPTVSRPRRLDSESCNSARKRKRRTPDEHTAPPATRSGLKRRKSVVQVHDDDDDDDDDEEDDDEETDTMDLDSGTSVQDGDEQAQSGRLEVDFW